MSKTKPGNLATHDLDDLDGDVQSHDEILSQHKHYWTYSKLHVCETSNKMTSKSKNLTKDMNGTHSNADDNEVDEEWSEMFDDDLEDVPSFEELPSVLFLTGDIDFKTLKRSREIYQQKLLMSKILEQNNGMQTDQETSRSFSESFVRKQNKNKNVSFKQKQTSLNSSFNEKRLNGAEIPNNPPKMEQIKPVDDHDEIKEQTDIIRKKRLEKLDKSNENHIETSEQTNHSGFRPELSKDDNRQVVMREEKLQRQKHKRKDVTQKQELVESEDSSTTAPFTKPHQFNNTNDKDKHSGHHALEKQGEGERMEVKEGWKSEKEAEYCLKDKDVRTKPKDLSYGDSEIPPAEVKQHGSKSEVVKTFIPKTETSNSASNNINNDNNNNDDDDDDDDIPYVVGLFRSRKRPQSKTTNHGTSTPETVVGSNSPFTVNMDDDGDEDDEDDDDDDDEDDEDEDEDETDRVDELYADNGKYSPKGTKSNKQVSQKSKPKPSQKSQTQPKQNKNTFGTSTKQARSASFNFSITEPEALPSTKPPIKNKNKTTLKTNDEKSKTATKPTTDVITDKKVEPVKKPNVLKLKLKDIDERRSRAFKSIKQCDYKLGVHCSSCGRPDCNSTNVQKMKEILQVAKQTGFEVRDVAPDGNCMFAAVVDQLEFYSNYSFSAKSLREAAVNWLIENPNNEDGTRFESFLEENWQTYLQKMLGEGQWGDHIVLKAIVQVIGHTVKVMSVDKGDCRWHTLVPSNSSAGTDDFCMILGNVGEFHYVSLRPSDHPGNVRDNADKVATGEGQAKGASEDLENIKLDGGESIAMFQEGHIDPESQVPVLHLSYLVKKIIPKCILASGAIYASNLEELAADMTKKQQQHIATVKAVAVGEVANKVFVEISFGLEMTKSCRLLSMNSDEDSVSVMDESTKMSSYILDETMVQPGYGRLKSRNSLPFFFPNETFQEQWERSNVSSSDSEYRDYVYKDGKFHTFFFSVPVIICKSWPGSAQSWITRVRCEGWPPQHVINSVISEGCVLKPYPHKNSYYPELEWQIGFELAEKTLFKDAVTQDQQNSYIVWKSLIMQTIDLSGPLTIDHLRTVFLYACERIPTDFWSSNPGACILYMFDELLRQLNAGVLPNYFVPTNNMVDDLTKKELRETREKLLSVRNQPFLFLLQFQEACHFLARGTKVIQMVQDDVPKFMEHRSVKATTLEALVPASILIAKEYLKAGYYVTGFDLLSQTYEERLAVSTCDDTLPYHLFLQDALNGLPQENIVWFSAYADIHLKKQLKNPIILEMGGDGELMKISDIIPIRCAGELAETLVPKSFSNNIFTFCNNFATFLRAIGKADTVKAVLYHAHDMYKIYVEGVGESQQSVDMTAESPMLQVYLGLYTVYQEQGLTAQLADFFPYMEKLVDRLNSRSAFIWLKTIYTKLGKKDRLGIIEKKLRNMGNAPPDSNISDYILERNMLWPYTKAMMP